jgi:uncharacterized protein (TIGR03032 family)
MNDRLEQAIERTASAKLEISTSRQFSDWLLEYKLSLAFTTYQSGKLFLIGLKDNGRLSVFERTFNRCMGLWGDGQTLWMSSLYQLWRFENALPAGEAHQGFDRLYVPQVGYTTGDLDIHDIATDSGGRPVFVATLFSCLGATSETASFVPLWHPPFISRLAAEDRCHLNGLTMKDGKAAYVTAVAMTDVADSWREHRRSGGALIEVASGQVVSTGLSMPHSPRLHNGTLYLLNSGTGHFGRVDLKTGKFEPIAFCPGYLRGLAFIDRFALVGLSRPRDENRTFAGLALGEALQTKNIEARSGIMVIDLKTGDIVHWLRVEGIVQELYDVVALPGVRQPMALGFKTGEIRRTITLAAQPVDRRLTSAGPGGL